MKKAKIWGSSSFLVIILVVGVVLFDNYYFKNNQIKFRYPWKNALFPVEFVAPTFDWKDDNNKNGKWQLTVNLKNKEDFYVKTVDKPEWIPNPKLWDTIKRSSNFQDVQVVIKRYNSSNRNFFQTRAELNFTISKDSVGAPLLYREIPLPFSYAEKNPQFMSFSLCNVADTNGSHTVLSQFRVCGNCHSFSQDGKRIALDFDAAARDKGGYFIANIDSQIVFSKKNYISWSKMLGQSTFGMLSKISWDGKFVVTTVKDRAVSEKFNEKEKQAYSQLFFPVNGVLSVYNIATKEFKELPGANDLDLVQTNAIWTPDGKNLIFARSKCLPYDKDKHVWDKIDRSIIDQFVNGKRGFKFDLYIIPFNNGKGGIARPIKGASNNDKSNYFPAISPDGKWLVFCQAQNFMMLQPDSKLFITNLETGATEALKSNLPSMNSWHAWSPNGKWLVYTSKLLSDYTDLYLTHIDNEGNASTPILIEKARKYNKALNYPEFVNRNPTDSLKMIYDYVNLYDIQMEMSDQNYEKAKILLDEYLAQSQIGTPEEFQQIALILNYFGRKEEAKAFVMKQKKIEPDFYRVIKK